MVDAPLPPEAEFAAIRGTSGGESYIYTTPKTVQETVDYYRNLAYPAGWQFQDVMSDSVNFANVILRKGKELHILSISFNQYSGWTEIAVNFDAGQMK